MDAGDFYSIDICKEKFNNILKEIYFNNNNELSLNQLDINQENNLQTIIKEYSLCKKQNGFIPPITFYTDFIGTNISKQMNNLSPQQRIDLKNKSTKVYQIIKSSIT